MLIVSKDEWKYMNRKGYGFFIEVMKWSKKIMRTMDELMHDYINVDEAIKFYKKENILFADTLYLVAKVNAGTTEAGHTRRLKEAVKKILFASYESGDKIVKHYINFKATEDLENLCDAFWAMCYQWADMKRAERFAATGDAGYGMDDGYAELFIRSIV